MIVETFFNTLTGLERHNADAWTEASKERESKEATKRRKGDIDEDGKRSSVAGGPHTYEILCTVCFLRSGKHNYVLQPLLLVCRKQRHIHIGGHARTFLIEATVKRSRFPVIVTSKGASSFLRRCHVVSSPYHLSLLRTICSNPGLCYCS